MYGMVNKAIVEYIQNHHDLEVWREIKAKANLPVDHFISMEQYPDSVSVAMIMATAEMQDRSATTILEEIGEYWIEFALKSDYGDLLEVSGDTLPEVLMNLNHLHERVGQAFANLDPPSFWCTDVTQNSLVLHYASSRLGLAPMVIGLVKGLSTMLGVTSTVDPITRPNSESDHAEFLVRY